MTITEVLERSRAFLFQRQRAYQTTFNAPVAFDVLADLAKFCRANESTYHESRDIAARLDGRREVWLRIANHLNLPPDQLWKIYSGLDK